EVPGVHADRGSDGETARGSNTRRPGSTGLLPCSRDRHRRTRPRLRSRRKTETGYARPENIAAPPSERPPRRPARGPGHNGRLPADLRPISRERARRMADAATRAQGIETFGAVTIVIARGRGPYHPLAL